MKGRLPDDKTRILAVIDRYRLEAAMRHLKAEAGGDMEKLLTELGDQYI